MKQRTINLLLAIVATLGLAVCAGLVSGLGSVLYEDPSTMRSIPKKTAAGYIATADGGVVNVMSGPAPTAVGQALRTTSIGTGTNQSVAAFTSDPVATTTGKGVVQLGTSARLSATTVTTTASTTATTVVGSDAMCILPKATTGVWGVSEYTTTLPGANGVPSAGSSGKAMQSDAVAPTEGVARTTYYATGSGGVVPTVLSRTSNTSTDSFSVSVGTTLTSLFDIYTASDPASMVVPIGTYALRVYAAAETSTTVTFSMAIDGYGFGTSTVTLTTSLAEYRVYFVPSPGVSLIMSNMELALYATAASGTHTITIGIGGTHSTSLSVPWKSSAADTPLSSSVSPRVAAGPGVAGTGTSAQRSDSQQGLSATNPNKGDFYRSPTGTDTATNTNAGWDHALDIVRYVGSGTADPTVAPGVPCVLAAASPATMCLYYQTLHCADGGCSYAIWWKSGDGATQWTQFGNGDGGGGGSQTIALTSPDGSINVGAGGGMTTVETNLGSLTTNYLTKALSGYTNRLAPSLFYDDGTTPKVFGTQGPAGFLNVNANNLASGTLINPGVALYYDGDSLYGMNVGYTSYYNMQFFTPPNRTIEMGYMDQPPINQSSFHSTYAFSPSTGGLALVGPISASNITPTPAPNVVVESDSGGTVCAWVETCGYQPALPACQSGQELVNGTRTDTATGTDTTTNWTCRTSPWQPAGDYQPALPAGTNNQVPAYSTTGSGATTNIVAKTPSVNAGNGISVSGTNPVTGLTISANIASSRNISTATASTTATSTATAMLGADAQVVIPVATTTGKGIAQAGTSATINSSTSSATASSTMPSTFMPADATANGDHKVSVASGSIPFYLYDAFTGYAQPVAGGYPIAVDIYDDGGGYKYVRLGARAGSSSVPGMLRLDPNAPPALDGGPAVIGSRGLAADSGNKPELGSNSPTPGDVLMGVSDTTTATATNTSTSTVSALKWGKLTESSIAGLTTDISTRPTGTGLTSGCILKAGSSSSVACGIGSDNGSTVTISGNIAANNITATPTASKIPVADTSGHLNAWIAGALRSVYSVDLTTTVSSNMGGTWVNVLQLGTSQYASFAVVMGSMSIAGSTTCHARLVLDGAQIGGELLGDAGGYAGFVSLSPIAYTSFAAGGHLITLQIASQAGSICTAGAPGTQRGSLIVTEYTN